MTQQHEHFRLQFGCGLCQPEGWLNFDSTPTLFAASIPLVRQISKTIWQAKYSKKFYGKSVPANHQILRNLAYTHALYGDITKGLPVPRRSCRQVYASHVIEHLPLESAKIALSNTAAILEPDGCFRIVVPDLKYYIDQYLASGEADAAIEFCLQTGMGSRAWGFILSRLRGDRHHLMYDDKALRFILEGSGFSRIRQAFYGDSNFDFSDVEIPERWQVPGTIGFECML